MSRLLHNIDSIICAFEEYAKKDDGDCSTLNKGELKQLIQKEFAQVIVDPYDPQTVETVLRLLDTDCDGKVDFEEFTVLVFKVAKACYKKVQECQASPEGVSKQGETSMQQQQQLQASQVSTHPPVQELQAPKKVPDAEDLSQDLKKEAPKLEISCGRLDEQVPMQENPADQRPQASRMQSIQRAIEELVKLNPTCQTSPGETSTEQDQAQLSQQERQSAGAPQSVCIQEPLSPDPEPNQDVAQEAAQLHQMEEPCEPNQQKVTSQAQVQERPTQQSAQEPEQIPTPRVTEEPLQKTFLTSSGGGNQQTQVEEQRATSGPIWNMQEEQTSRKCQEEGFSTVEQRPALQSELQHELEERPTPQQECQSRGQSLASAVGQQERVADGPFHRQGTGVRGTRQTQVVDQEYEAVSLGQPQAGQRRHQSQECEQAMVAQQNQEVQVPEQATVGHQGGQPRIPPSTYQTQQKEERPPRLGQRQDQSSVQGSLLRDQVTPQVAELAEAASVQGPHNPSARLPFQNLRSRLHFPSPWAPNQ